jgi:hypothetical protein
VRNAREHLLGDQASAGIGWLKDKKKKKKEWEERTLGEEELTLRIHHFTVLKAQVTGSSNKEEMSHSKIPVK